MEFLSTQPLYRLQCFVLACSECDTHRANP